LGVKRVTRLAELLSEYGGTICYETALTDEFLVRQRLACIRTFLEDNELDRENIRVVAAQSRGRGMTAVDAMAIRTGVSASESPTGSGAGLSP
jgi:hypothetical protein